MKKLMWKREGFLDSLTFSGLAKVGIFTTNVDAENQTLISKKCVCGALNRHFCQTRVMRSYYYTVVQFFNPIQSKVPIAIAV
jgi:hypothetical protein